ICWLRDITSSAISGSSSPSELRASGTTSLHPLRTNALLPNRSMKSKSIVAQACCRVDLAGSTLDIWPLYLFHPGAMTVNFAVSVMTGCEIRPAEQNTSREIVLRSLDTEREDHLANALALMKAKQFDHALAGYLCRFFFST